MLNDLSSSTPHFHDELSLFSSFKGPEIFDRLSINLFKYLAIPRNLNTPFGRYYFKRMAMGLTSAPEKFHCIKLISNVTFKYIKHKFL